jgi:hypothetical protein
MYNSSKLTISTRGSPAQFLCSFTVPRIASQVEGVISELPGVMEDHSNVERHIRCLSNDETSTIRSALIEANQHLAGLISEVRDDPPYRYNSIYLVIRPSNSPHCSLLGEVMFVEDPESLPEDKLWRVKGINQLVAVIRRIMALSEGIVRHRTAGSRSIDPVFTFGPILPTDPKYPYRILDDYTNLKAAHDIIMSLNNFRLLSLRSNLHAMSSIDSTTSPSLRGLIRHALGIETSPVDQSACLSSNVMRRALEFVLPAGRSGGK